MPNMQEISRKRNVHVVLAHSYVAYLLLFLVGLLFNFIFFIKISNNNEIIQILGFVFLLFGTFIIIWAQKASRSLNKENINKNSFCQGPYCYTRMPTHWGLFFVMLGFGIYLNSLFIIIFSFISLLINKKFFINEEESILSEKYGSPYLEYKKAVKF